MLLYVVPLVFQRALTTSWDLEGSMINDSYCKNPEYKTLSLNVCVLSLEDFL